MADELRVGAIGAAIRATVRENGSALDVSGASTKQLVFKKPDGTKVTQTATFYTDGTDGVLQYTTVSGDIDQAGSWQCQAYLAGLSGFSGYTDPDSLRVKPNL